GEEPLSTELSIGAVFAERYRVERRLASGGMGAVYEVVHVETNRRRALKILHTKFMQSDMLRKRFRQEARVAAEIDSEHIVDIFDAGIDPTTDMPFLVMELLRGEDLRSRVRRDGPLPYDLVIHFLYETSLALEKTHKANIVHRDLKPDNLFLCEREHGLPRVKVLDFGIAKIIADGGTETQLTQSLGTPLYMAPEQFSMQSSVSPATDIFALGLIAYTLLVGKPYWLTESKQAQSPIAFALHAAQGPQESAVERAAKLQVTLPAAFDAWFFRATSVLPADRFPSASVAVAQLADVLGVPMLHESTRGKSDSMIPRALETSSPGPDDLITLDEPISPEGHLSSSLHAVRTVCESALDALPKHSRPKSVVMVVGIVSILAAGPILDGLFGSRVNAPTNAGSSVAEVAAGSLESAAHPAIAASTEASPFVSAPKTAEAPSASASASASAEAPASDPTKSTTARPASTTKKNPTRELWNND
ncbi:MAG TPA: serine/threonine-protein kinase, partial [Polyangium sp.]|nr:serine/threonine-protein kinase [Polyangium sp.]